MRRQLTSVPIHSSAQITLTRLGRGVGAGAQVRGTSCLLQKGGGGFWIQAPSIGMGGSLSPGAPMVPELKGHREADRCPLPPPDLFIPQSKPTALCHEGGQVQRCSSSSRLSSVP